ncbi:MAG TPA: hypothetical protein VJ204_02380 [Solirubrobacterales bacterium]|nr:hypothetical protein [Solirubrobacterales bacterium]
MKLRRHLTYANVISTLCLFLVLGGGAAFAATKLAKSSVGTEQLKGEAVTKGKLAPNSVNSKKVVDGSLTGEDIASSTLGKVPNATNAEHAASATTAGSANSASTATNASHATSADTATNAADAEKLDGHTPSEFGAVLIANPDLFMAELEAEAYFSVSGSALAQATIKGAPTILPNRKFRASEFAIHLEGEAQAGISVHASLVVNGAETEVCTLTAVPSTCTPSTSVEIPAGAQVAWKLATATPVAEVRPTLALRLGPA